MPDYTQAKLPMRVETVLDEDVLLLDGLSGEEGLSSPFVYHLDLLSEDPGVDGEALLRTEVRVAVDLPDGETRSIHGIVRRFVQLRRDRDLTAYRAEVVPWLWFLSLARDCRIFQEKDVLEIAETVFSEQGYSDFEIRCTRQYPKREYCVQYRETNLDFVSRLLEEEGIFYFFEHSEGKHLLVLADDMSSIRPCEGQPEARIHSRAGPDEDVVLELEREHAVHPGRVTLADYDYLQPSLHLMTSVTGSEPEEVYDFPGDFADLDNGDRNARLALEREEALRHVVRGASTCRGFHTGGRFDLLDHFRSEANQAYAFLQVRHRASSGGFRAGTGTGEFDYRNEFLAVPHEVPFRPPRTVAKPSMQGAQTAVVVGPSGEEIWVDEHSRVKVQFHWDRQGSRDENSSCWIRVASSWSGKAWGVVEIPRIGQEVLVGFLEGDPDRPIIIGSVYNAEQTPPWDLPAEGTISGVKSRSSKGGGGYNEISLQDRKGEEMVRIHAQKDMSATVLNNRTDDVGNDRSRSVGNDEKVTVGNDQTLDVGNDQGIDVSGDRSVAVHGNQDHTVQGNRSTDVAGNDDVTVNGSRSVDVTGPVEEKTSATYDISAVGPASLSAPQVKVEGSAQVEVTAGGQITISAGGMLEIKAAAIKLTAGVIELAGLVKHN